MTKENPSIDALKSARETMANASRTLGTMSARERIEEKIEKESSDTLVQKVKDMAIAARRVNKAWDGTQELYEKVSPYLAPVMNATKWTFGKLKSAFTWAAFERDSKGIKLDAEGDPIFSGKRLMTTFGLAAMLGMAVIGGVQTAYYNATQFSEIVYVTGRQEIVPGELYQFTGCTSLPCSTQTDHGKYYRIAQSYYSPRLIYPEQDVYANVPNQMSACAVQGYGVYFRQLKPLFRWTELYQHVYDVSCRPLSPGEIQHAMDHVPSAVTGQPQVPRPAGP